MADTEVSEATISSRDLLFALFSLIFPRDLFLESAPYNSFSCNPCDSMVVVECGVEKFL